LNPNLALAYINIGYAQNQMGDYNKALVSAERSLSLATEPREIGIAHYVIGVANEKLERRENAASSYRQSIAAYKRANLLAGDDYYYVGNAHFFLGENQPSIDAYKQAIKLRPDFAQPHFNLGIVYNALGKKRSALEEYQLLRRLDPERAQKLRALIDAGQ
jgi:tetratricopeptide (TPR) repeat protein